MQKTLWSNYTDINERADRDDFIRYINFKLATIGQPQYVEEEIEINECSKKLEAVQGIDQNNIKQHQNYFISIAENLIQDYREKSRLLSDYLCPSDRRVEDFLNRYLENAGVREKVNVPTTSFILDQPGLASAISLPPKGNKFQNSYIHSYRINQGILHNPKNDRRTTKGSFHIVADGLPVPMDKKEVPANVFAHLFDEATNPPEELNTVPFTSLQQEKAKCFLSLYLRPIVSPEIKGYVKQKTMEIRFFVPGSLACTLDFIESIFGNAGDPTLCTNDAGLDVETWSGHTGFVILAPHLINLKKKDLGLPEKSEATQRQIKDGMFWEDEDERYNDGVPFKLTCRNEEGVAVTIIADSYFGYAKKEVKTQISYACNLLGLSEEEHAGGAVAFPRKNIGEYFYGIRYMERFPYTFHELKQEYGDIMDLKPENYGVDKKYKNVLYVPETTEINLYKQFIKWEYDGEVNKIKLLPDYYYVLPSGYRVHMEKHPTAPSWRLIGTHPKGTFIHKPCTVSGGGKSEISKSLLNAIIYGSFYIQDFQKDFSMAKKIIDYDYKNRWKSEKERVKPSRPILSSQRTLGSVIKLLTPSPLCTEEYNRLLNTIPNHVKALVLFIKRFYREEWGDNWIEHFSVDMINGREGNSLFYNHRKIMASYLRVGFNEDSSWFLHKLRADFIASAKIQMEDDISSSITVPAKNVDSIDSSFDGKSVKIVSNCEYRFFQRPDEAIIKGYDKQTEADMALKNNFVVNYEALTQEDAKEIIDDAIGFDLYTEPIKNLIQDGATGEKSSFFVSPSHPRKIEGKISKNPRYLQSRPDFVAPVDYHLAEIGTRLFKRIPLHKPVNYAVNEVIAGRRNNPPQKDIGIRALSVYNPIHYQELPELFMDFICSLTGKSPSTTGAGSEGALTKGPFNMLNPTTDLNNALLSYIFTGYNGFTSAAGYIGTENRFDHDISILIPELWSRLEKEEVDPEALIEERSFEKMEDFDYNGEKILASRLGYRMTENFLFKYFGRIFDEPQAIFTQRMLKPEIQDMEAFVDGIKNITEAQKKSAELYFEDESVENAIPPLKALLHNMVYGEYEGHTLSDPEVRNLFTREYVLESDWYRERLNIKQQRDIAHLERIIDYIENFALQSINENVSENMKLSERLAIAKQRLEHVSSNAYLEELIGTIGADPLFK